jgi:hypothetical protein
MLWSGCATGLTGGAFNTSGTKTRVSGDVISNAGGDVQYWFQYGKTTTYGSETTHDVASGTQANQSQGVSAQITGLDRDTTYTGTTLRNNRADDNGDFGIDAVAGVTDGGGNTASGNGNPLQCRNVFCQ